MDALKTHLEKLSFLTRLEKKYGENEEKWVLSKHEEEEVFKNAVKQAESHQIWKILQNPILTTAQKNNRILGLKIDLSDKREEILKKANSCKLHKMWEDEQRKKDKDREIEERLKLQKIWTAEQLFFYLKRTAKDEYNTSLIVNENTKPLIKVACYYLAEDKRFETEFGFSLDKGLLIRGVCGLGKSFIFECLANNPLNPVKIISAIDIQKKVKKYGDYELFMNGRSKLYLDDVGSERSEVNHFGTPINWVKDFIELQYLKNRKWMKNVIMSTNDSFDELGEKYGFRWRDRMRQIVNVFDAKGESLRK